MIKEQYLNIILCKMTSDKNRGYVFFYIVYVKYYYLIFYYSPFEYFPFSGTDF